MSDLRVMIGGRRVAKRNPDALVVNPFERRIHGLMLSRRMGAGVFRLLSALVLRGGHLVPYSEVIDAIWGDREDGGPLDCRHRAHRMVWFLRQQLAEDGYWIRAVHGRGYSIERVPVETRRAA